jgi:hypothetical protein
MANAKGLAAAGLLIAAALALAPVSAQDDRPRRVENVTLEDEGCPAGPDRFCVQPSEVTLEEGTDLILRVTNEGRVEHNLTFATGTPGSLAKHGMNGTLAVNDTRRLAIPWPAVEEAGQVNATLHCGQEGHAALGETLRVHVPSLAADERPQPGPGALATLGALGAVAWARRREDG